ncbi:MAG: two pore domain potassium channel family protein [Oscillochloris sp.]|nr:two pore domain potassium channel family protein [Oscillochloris sp.]
MRPPSATRPQPPSLIAILLILVIIVQFIYPISSLGGPFWLIVYQLLYASLLGVATLTVRTSPPALIGMITLTIIFIISNAIYSFNTTQRWALFLGYFATGLLQLTVLRTLVRLIFSARVVTREVLYAATAVYLLLGGFFVPIYGFIETLQPGSFIDSAAPGDLVSWQQFIYYSYVTLTTMGYGDILPHTMWARSLATFEAVCGVLYVTIIMARLVSIYTAEFEAEH